MLNISITLKHYKRPEIQQAMLYSAKDREVAVRFGENGFGKRPDILNYPAEILELAKQGVTSFHVSEEHWNNVLALSPELSKKDLDDLRKGWDLVLDIDCKYWNYSKLITHLLIEQLKEHGVSSISVKFSGSKGFHIGVPFEAFPQAFPTVEGLKETRLLFPEGPKRIALYLKDKIEPLVLKELRKDKSDKEIAEMVGVKQDELIKTVCRQCGAEPKESLSKAYFVCPSCQAKIEAQPDASFMNCQKCSQFMEKIEPSKAMKCYKCSSSDFEEKFNISLILDIDTVLISSRHMYRMPYSLHEKSSLCSIVIPPDKVLSFEKEMALPSNIKEYLTFLDISSTKEGEAAQLIMEAFDHKPVVQTEKVELNKEYEVPAEAIPASMFPPCMIKGMNGIQDGKKRFMFALINFLECTGYDNDAIDRIVREWNKRNPEPLREVLVNSQLRYRKVQKRGKILPPNCMQAYQEINLCAPDHLCGKIKNPVQYAKTKAYISKKEEKPKRTVLTEDQKEMRRKYKELKKENSIDLKKENDKDIDKEV